jgi:hypothetical protein
VSQSRSKSSEVLTSGAGRRAAAYGFCVP